MKVLEPYTLKNLTLRNRIVMPPMCMYQADTEGNANIFHQTHYATRALGGVGLMIFEATGVSPEGRISDRDLGLWKDEQIDRLKEINQLCQSYGAKTAIQLNHAGRKCEASVQDIFAPSSIAFSEAYRSPTELSLQKIHEIVLEFKEAAKRAEACGFDAIEIHGAHGYLIHQFLSPISNLRKDAYGGDVVSRARFLKEILTAIKEVWPIEKPILLRISASDYQEGGIDLEDMIHIINEVKASIDMVHVSSGGNLPKGVKSYPGYQVRFSEGIKHRCQIPTIAVGQITQPNMAEEILCNDRADLVALGRELLRNPYWVLTLAKEKGIEDLIPTFYKRAYL